MAYLVPNNLVFPDSVALIPIGMPVLLLTNLQSWLHIQVLVDSHLIQTHNYRIRIFWSVIWVGAHSKSPTGDSDLYLL